MPDRSAHRAGRSRPAEGVRVLRWHVRDYPGRRAGVRRGDLAFYDTQRPYEGIMGTKPGQPVQGMTFMFPPSMLPLSRNRISDLTATRIPATSGLGELTSQFLLQLARNVDH